MTGALPTSPPTTAHLGATAPLTLEARGLTKAYGSVVALDGADFEVRAGEILAVIGDNGAGKEFDATRKHHFPLRVTVTTG